MIKFINKTLLLVLLVTMYWGWQLTMVKPRTGCVINMLNVKDSLMDVTPSPRLVVLGGSSAAYGINSPMLRDSLKLNIVNSGLSAGFGLKYILEEATPHLRKGDIVIICLEYAHFYGTMYGNEVGLGPAMYWTGFRNLHLLNQQQLIYAIKGLPTAVRMNLSTKKQSYATDVFNEYGDVVIRPSASKYRQNEQINSKINEEFAQCFIQCVENIEKKGCRVLIAPQVICKQSFRQETGDDVSLWLKQHGRAFIASPESHCMPDSFGLDTDNHMTEEGARIFTNKLIQEIKKLDLNLNRNDA